MGTTLQPIGEEPKMNINNNKTIFALTALATLLVGFPGICQAQPPAEATKAAAEAPKTKRVMVVTFQQLDRKIKDNIPLGQEIADRVTQGLVMRGARVVERADLAAIEKERGLISGNGDKAAVLELGKLKGAAVAIMGKITEFGIVEKQSSASGEVVKSVLGRLKPVKDKVGGKPFELRVSMDVRLVSIDTGDILAASSVLVTEGTDESDINTLLSKGFGSAELLKLGLNSVLGNKNKTEEAQTPPQPADKNTAWNESQAGKCTERAVQQLVARLMEKIPLASENDIEDMKVSALQFQGLGDYSEATQIVAVLEKLAGIAGAELKNYTPELTEITVRGSAKALKSIVGSLQADESLKGFNLRVVSANQDGVVFKKG
ncbi:CsgG/HfaB family protein [Armatimonas sp.]|uniref:CsgG/HfaB family protein n=1 Tax=Armatimonas sp. TaxID=1872638 RepID=UPI00286BDE98|nr:CsgG/HfaB family protein [Armatimonas sp.]